MPPIGGVLVAVAPFPASLGAGELVAAVRGYIPTGLAGLAGCLGKRVACHLRDPLRCRLAVRGMAGRVCLPSWRRSRQWDVVALTAYARQAPVIPDRLRRRRAREQGPGGAGLDRVGRRRPGRASPAFVCFAGSPTCVVYGAVRWTCRHRRLLTMPARYVAKTSSQRTDPQSTIKGVTCDFGGFLWRQ
jgi:hypothetical protein